MQIGPVFMSELEAQDLAIRTRGLARRFHGRPAVASLDLDVRRGELFGLVGPDGAGKSTAIRLLCGLLRPSAGDGTVLGHDLLTQTEAIKARIGYLSQQFTLYGDLTVDENIEFFADLHGVADFMARRDDLLRFMGLTPFRDRLAAALSGGMKKKLALACTLIHTPDLILLDEPSTGVDPVSRGEFWNILSDVLAQGVTIVMTTPYLDEAERCNRVGLMHAGTLVRVGSPAEIKSALPGKAFDLDCPDPSAAYRAVRRQWAEMAVVRYGDRLHIHVPGGDAEGVTVVAWMEAHGLGPVTLRPAATSLDDVFVALLGSDAIADPRHDAGLQLDGLPSM
jgi:ABC-2 type transport system ATP-binding protein